jgi:hypothetical protein
MLQHPCRNMGKGFCATVWREVIFSALHYTHYAFLKESLLRSMNTFFATFAASLIASVFAVTFSHPFEVIRSRVSFEHNLSMFPCIKAIWRTQGWRGFLTGFTPRIFYKSFNTGISWALLDGYHSQ